MESLRRDLFGSVTVLHGDNVSDDIDSVGEVFHLPTLPSKLELTYALRRHCNRIICLEYNEIILCNPATKEWSTLPKPCLIYCDFYFKGMGFGYDSILGPIMTV